jgi:predicted O-methyltransferase YrrM
VGRSAIALGLGAQVSGARVATIDYGADPSHDALLRENLARCGVADTVTVYRARSETVAETWTADVQLLFIDGWHDAEHIQRDLDAWLPHSADGGLLLFHDAHGAGWPDVDAAVDRLCDVGWASTRWELLGYDGTIAILRRTR